MYLLGVPIGMFVDRRGPRPAAVAGAALLGLGYFLLHQAYDNATGTVGAFFFFSFLTGQGACMAFAAAVKTSALNWPRHRGTATAFPLAGFGLSAFFFSTLGSGFFPTDTSAFLAMLAIGTSGLTVFGFFFLHVLPHCVHRSFSRRNQADSQVLHRPAELTMEPHSSPQAPHGFLTEAGTSYSNDSIAATCNADCQMSMECAARNENRSFWVIGSEPGETTSLTLRSVTLRDDILTRSPIYTDHLPDVGSRGFRLVQTIDFWQQFSIMGILSGVGLMTIK